MKDEDKPLIAQQLDLLFETKLNEDDKPYTLTDVAEATGLVVQTMSKVKVGKVKHPSFDLLATIARFFAIPVDYFACQSIQSSLAYLARHLNERESILLRTRVDKMAAELQTRAYHLKNYIDLLEEREDLYGEVPDEILKDGDVEGVFPIDLLGD